MGIRIQPGDIEIPEQDPFQNDLLGRKEPVQVLTNLLRSIEGPCVLAVDGAWGAGKTTFLNILSGHLRCNDFQVVKFNAWETDFSDDPFLALSQELTNGLRQSAPGSLQDRLGEVTKAAKEVLRRALPGTIRVATAGILDVGPLIEKETGQALASYAQSKLDNYLEARKSVLAFKQLLGELASELAKANDDLPLVVVIDELDRCRPSYAVELLETAKHFFTVDHVVFVLALNRTELAHSVRAVYGAGFDGDGYLRRFVDIYIRLPDSKRRTFVDVTLTNTGIRNYFLSRSEHDNYEVVRDWLVEFFDAFDISLRSIAQAIHHLGLVLASLRKGRGSLPVAATLALILRTVDLDRYHRFARGEVDDRELVEFLLNSRSAVIERKAFLEGAIIVAAMEVRYPERYHSEMELSPHLREYQKWAEETGKDDDDNAKTIMYAREVVSAVNWFRRQELRGGHGLGFNEAVRRFELISPSLLSNRSGAE